MMTLLDAAVSNKPLQIPLKINFYLIQSLDRGSLRVGESRLIVFNLIFEELRKRHKILRDRIPEIPSAVQFVFSEL
jgi:hypothetical protein